ncbi:hypothetical protein [Niastella caeni]|nr:hypothetical protein [Niastella caeni]
MSTIVHIDDFMKHCSDGVHAKTEEEISYSAAILIGEYLTLKLEQV